MKKFISLIFMLTFVLALVGCRNDEFEYEPPFKIQIDMVVIDGVLYENTNEVSDRIQTDIMTFDGQITSAVNGMEVPTQDDQSNFGTGHLYVFGDENTVEVLLGDEFWIFEAKNK